MMWTRDSINAELIALFKEHAEEHTGGAVDVTEGSHLVADLGIDSLGVMEMIQKIEDRFNLVIPDEALQHIDTLKDVARAVEGRLRVEGRLGE